jgi:hypothetical protein
MFVRKGSTRNGPALMGTGPFQFGIVVLEG